MLSWNENAGIAPMSMLGLCSQASWDYFGIRCMYDHCTQCGLYCFSSF